MLSIARLAFMCLAMLVSPPLTSTDAAKPFEASVDGVLARLRKLEAEARESNDKLRAVQVRTCESALAGGRAGGRARLHAHVHARMHAHKCEW